MEFQVLGRISIARGGDVVCPAGRLARTLLAVLLSRAGTPVRAGELTEALWPGLPPDRSAPKLHIQVSRLRTALGDRDRLRFEQGAYRLRTHPGELDVERFVAMTAEAAEQAGADAHRCVELSRKALASWQGDPYPGVDVPAVADDTARLRERRLLAQDVLFRAELRRRRHREVLPELIEFATAHPLHEPAQRLLIAAYHFDGRQAEAITTYRTMRRRLVEELGVEPSPQSRELAGCVRAGQPVPIHCL